MSYCHSVSDTMCYDSETMSCVAVDSLSDLRGVMKIATMLG
jgi:hypothetical protein